MGTCPPKSDHRDPSPHSRKDKSVSALRWMVRHLLGSAGASFSVQKFFDSLPQDCTSHSKVADATPDHVARTRSHTVRCPPRPRPLRAPFAQRLLAIANLSSFARILTDSSLRFRAVAMSRRLQALPANWCNFAISDGVQGWRWRSNRSFMGSWVRSRRPANAPCAVATCDATAGRELRTLHEAMREYPTATAHLVALDDRGLPRATPAGTRAQAAAKGFLAAP